jgi:thioredoxin-like negative regulator of GroEL
MEQENWEQAAQYITRLEAITDDPELLTLKLEVLKNQGDLEGALEAARELYNQNEEEYIIEYVDLLLDTQDQDTARQVINDGVNTYDDLEILSALHFRQALLSDSRTQQLSLLRTSLFEDPQNVDALIAMADFYMADEDYRRALIYLRQAIDLRPGDEGIRQRMAITQSRM